MNNPKHSGADPYGNLAGRTSANRSKTGLMIVGATVAVVAVLVVVAVLLTGGSDDDAADGTGAAAAQDATQEAGSVEVVGKALPAYPDTSGFAAPASEDPAVGQTPPTLIGQTFDGSALTIEPGADDKAMVVVFVAHWCPHCQAEVPLLQQWIDDGNLPDDVEMYAVSTAVAADRPNYPPSAWLSSEGWDPKVLLDNADNTAATAWALPGFPYMVFVDADGKVAQPASGELPIDQFDEYVSQISAAQA